MPARAVVVLVAVLAVVRGGQNAPQLVFRAGVDLVYLESDVRSNTEAQTPDGRLFVILRDDAMIPFDPRAIKSAKEIAPGVIDRLGPNDLAAVVFSASSNSAQNFTHDRAKLFDAVDG